jgi:hypothetical protein
MAWNFISVTGVSVDTPAPKDGKRGKPNDEPHLNNETHVQSAGSTAYGPGEATEQTVNLFRNPKVKLVKFEGNK